MDEEHLLTSWAVCQLVLNWLIPMCPVLCVPLSWVPAHLQPDSLIGHLGKMTPGIYLLDLGHGVSVFAEIRFFSAYLAVLRGYSQLCLYITWWCSGGILATKRAQLPTR